MPTECKARGIRFFWSKGESGLRGGGPKEYLNYLSKNA